MRFLRSSLIAFSALCIVASTAPSQTQNTQSATPRYDKSVFQDTIAADQLEFLHQFAGTSSGKLMRDKRFRKILQEFVPNCMFHYGRDMPLIDALDMVFDGSQIPVEIRDGRYLAARGAKGPYLRGQGFIWIDMQDGIGLGGFYFHPTNGEPTPTVAAFSKQMQVQDRSIGMSQLPPEFAGNLNEWAAESSIPALTTRYFLTGVNTRILLEHDGDYCLNAGGAPSAGPGECEQMNADAADIDVNAAYYLEQVNYATNATAWMIDGEDQVAWIQVRDTTCAPGPDRLPCLVRVTRERTHVIVTRVPIPHVPTHLPPHH